MQIKTMLSLMKSVLTGWGLPVSSSSFFPADWNGDGMGGAEAATLDYEGNWEKRPHMVGQWAELDLRHHGGPPYCWDTTADSAKIQNSLVTHSETSP